jgi:hypothetical protein
MGRADHRAESLRPRDLISLQTPATSRAEDLWVSTDEWRVNFGPLTRRLDWCNECPLIGPECGM